MAVQFSLSYDANGDPVLVENTVTGTRKVVSRSTVVSPYKSRFDTADPITDAEENQPDSNQSAIYDYIKEMEGGAADDINLSFVEKQNLQSYTPEAIEAIIRAFQKYLKSEDYKKFTIYFNKIKKYQVVPILHYYKALRKKQSKAPLPVLKNIFFNLITSNIILIRQ